MTDTIQPLAATGRLTVNPGDSIASTWGNTTYDQTMEVFDTAAQRDAQWPTPHDGALAYTLDTQQAWIRRAGAWLSLSGTPAPLASGAALATVTDAAGVVWVAKGGVNAGAWKRATDVLHAAYYRNAAISPTTTIANFPYDTVLNDDYGIYVPGTAAITLPVAGIWRVFAQIAYQATAVGQYIAVLLSQPGQGAWGIQHNANATAPTASVASVTRRYAAGLTLTTQAQTSGATLPAVVGTVSYCHLDIDYLGTG
jgi:hypothetical protein